MMFDIKDLTLVKKSNQVETTQNYNLFSYLPGNRNINNLHIKRLKESMQNKYLFTAIIVNENHCIIDGQHRFEAIKELELPLRYIVIKGYGLNEVQILNTNAKTWSANDYLNGCCDLGYKHYITYKNFKNKYGLGHNETQLLLGGKHSKGIGAEFSMGTFKVTQYNKAVEYANHIISLKEFYKGWKRRSFVYAMIKLLGKENFDIEFFKNKLKTQPSALVDCTTVPRCIMLIEEIYNYKNRNKVNLRF